MSDGINTEVDPLCCPDTVRRLLDCTDRTLRRWRKDGLFPPPDVLIGGNDRIPRWRLSTVQRFIKNGSGSRIDKATVDIVLLRRRLEAHFDSFTQREQTVLKMRYGLKNSRLYTLVEIAKLIGFPRERVRQIEAEALEKLQDG